MVVDKYRGRSDTGVPPNLDAKDRGEAFTIGPTPKLPTSK
jgi:hypothetical protein